MYFLADYLVCENSIGCSFLFCGWTKLPSFFLYRYHEIWKCKVNHIALWPHVMRATLLQDELMLISITGNWLCLVKMFLWCTLLTVGILVAFSHGFNLDTNHPIVYEDPLNATGQRSSYFGFSVLLHSEPNPW